ncbi:MAG TPA: hypothetical protein P5526_13935, partial [Anaerolineae bacterium]|nr:hypothetical protein [Anaerolineae bacterium]
MLKRKKMFLWAGLLALSMLAACNSSVAPILSLNQQVESSQANDAVEITIAETGETNADMGAASVADAGAAAMNRRRATAAP